MLLLSRKSGQSIVLRIGEDVVEITVIQLKDDQVRLGIEAPRHVIVHRKELLNKQ
jgi:carbon storage regulator